MEVQNHLETIHVLTCRLDQEYFAFDLRHVKEIQPVGDCTPLPLTAPYIKGVVPIRERLIPVMDLYRRFGWQEKTADHQRLVILENGEAVFAVIVDETRDIVEAQRAPQDDFPEEVRVPQRFVEGILSVEGQTVPLLNLQELLGKPSLAARFPEKAGHL